MTGDNKPIESRAEVKAKRDVQFWLDVAMKLTVPLGAIVAAALANHFEQNRANLQLINQREQAESSLRATMFGQLIAPIASIIDKVIPDKAARDKAKLDLLALQGTQEMQQIQTQLSAIVAEANAKDPWTSRARPSFLYVMYVIILWAQPMGVIAAFRPDTARDIAAGINAYLNGLPEPLYALFGTGYLGYTAMRQWGKVKGVE